MDGERYSIWGTALRWGSAPTDRQNDSHHIQPTSQDQNRGKAIFGTGQLLEPVYAELRWADLPFNWPHPKMCPKSGPVTRAVLQVQKALCGAHLLHTPSHVSLQDKREGKVIPSLLSCRLTPRAEGCGPFVPADMEWPTAWLCSSAGNCQTGKPSTALLKECLVDGWLSLL